MKRLAKSTIYILLLVVAANLAAQTDIYDGGGPLMPEQAAYDVINYDLSLQIWPDEQRIDGKVRIDLIVVHPMYWLVLDLDTLLDVHQIYTPRVARPPFTAMEANCGSTCTTPGSRGSWCN
ncbi:MAG: hypothetical protein IPN33_03450 [Saprospiraceae bacterium]|nr:hypothetical protein [Saprospiraceae bacterium]